jgi:hypothetical protein
MIHGGWSYVDAAYAVTLAGLVGLALIVVLRYRHWARAARALDKPDPKL